MTILDNGVECREPYDLDAFNCNVRERKHTHHLAPTDCKDNHTFQVNQPLTLSVGVGEPVYVEFV